MNENFNYENRFKVIFASEEYSNLSKNVVDITIPSIDIGTTIQPTMIRNLYIPGNSIEFGDITITFLLDEEYTNYKKIFDWVKICRDFDEINAEKMFSDISVVLLNTKFNPILTLKFENCFPFNLSDIPLNYQITTTEPVRFVTVFKINGYKIE